VTLSPSTSCFLLNHSQISIENKACTAEFFASLKVNSYYRRTQYDHSLSVFPKTDEVPRNNNKGFWEDKMDERNRLEHLNNLELYVNLRSQISPVDS
jgi:hypothetical protein